MREKLDDGHLATVSPGDHPHACGKNYPLSLTEMFPEAITPRMREQTSGKIFPEVSLSLFQNSPLTHQDGPGRAEIHRG